MRLLSSDAEKILAWLQNQAERLMTPRGAIFYDLGYGLDVRSYIGDDEDPAVAAHEINQQLLQDERTATATTNISVNADGSWTIKSYPGTADGTVYELSFSVTGDKTTLLSAGPSSP